MSKIRSGWLRGRTDGHEVSHLAPGFTRKPAVEKLVWRIPHVRRYAEPADPSAARLDGAAIGRIHYLVAIAWFAISYTLTGTFHDQVHSATLNVLRWVAMISLAALVIALVVRPLRRKFFAISERVFILAINLFYLIAAVLIA